MAKNQNTKIKDWVGIAINFQIPAQKVFRWRGEMGVQTCPVYLKANSLVNTIRFTLNFNLGSFAAKTEKAEPQAAPQAPSSPAVTGK